jgi:hypothetical protein
MRNNGFAFADKIFLLRNTSQNSECTTKSALDAELDIGIETIPHHTRAGFVEMELALDRLHHRLAGLPKSQWLLAGRVDQRGEDGSRSQEKRFSIGKGAVHVSGKEDGTSLKVGVSDAELQVIDVGVQASQHHSDVGIQEASVSNGGKVFAALEIAAEARIRPTHPGDILGFEFGGDSGLAQNVDFVLRPRQLEDAGNVNGSTVCRAEDLVLGVASQIGPVDQVKGMYDFHGDTEAVKFLLVVRPGFGTVVRDEDELLPYVIGQTPSYRLEQIRYTLTT